MAVIPIQEPKHRLPPDGWAPFALGFRPFFLAAGLTAALLILLWLPLWHGVFAAPAYYGTLGWHSHEMLFGYMAAVVAGFLLTAVRNWTGVDTASGRPLALLAGIWLAGRLAPWLPGLPGPVVAVADLAFLLALAAALAGPLWRGSNRVNRRFLPLLLVMAAADGLIHAEALGLLESSAAPGTTLMLDAILLLLIWVAGRVMPFFTERAVPGAAPRRRQWVELGGFVVMGLLGAAHLLGLPAVATGGLALLQAGLQGLRLGGWHHPGLWRVPILWVLHLGYGWLVAGFLLLALADFGLFPGNLATHAFTMGAFGVVTLGMMARVSLGHTGREMRSARTVNAAFVLLNLGVAARVVLPAALPGAYGIWIDLAGLLWMLSFALFVWVYAPILVRPRVDGLAG